MAERFRSPYEASNRRSPSRPQHSNNSSSSNHKNARILEPRKDLYRVKRHHDTNHVNTCALTISGEGIDANNIAALLAWLARKARKLVQFDKKTTLMSNGQWLVSVAHPAQAQALLRCHNYKYMDIPNQREIKVSIQCAPNEMIWNAPEKMNAMMTFLQQRYDHAGQSLNLNNLKDDATLASAQINSMLTESFFQQLAKLLKNNNLQPITISFESNHCSNLKSMSSLLLQLPTLQNVSLANNELERLSNLEVLTSLTTLRELLLTGNERLVSSSSYRAQVAIMFPNLQLLDGTALTLEEKKSAQSLSSKANFDVPDLLLKANDPSNRNSKRRHAHILMPKESQSSFFETPQTTAVIRELWSRFTELFDRDRSQLSDIYHAKAHFSLGVNNNCHPSKSQPRPVGRHWTTTSQDLYRRRSTVSAPAQRTIEMLSQLPRTCHRSEYLMDVWQESLGRCQFIKIHVHGVLDEVSRTDQKSPLMYDRTLLLVPSPSNSNATLKGWNILITHDILIVRPYTVKWHPFSRPLSPHSFLDFRASSYHHIKSMMEKPTCTDTPTPFSSFSTPSTPPVYSNVGATPLSQEEVLIQQFSSITQLNTNFARLCLIESGWCADKALDMFRQAQADHRIPPEAFIHVPP